MTIDDDDTTGGRAATGTDVIKLERNGKIIALFTVSRPVSGDELAAVMKQIKDLLKD